MEKILKKYTTIPQHLYVERYADTQLKRIIEDMQRPGYVLVARQMGKTNLLFNAKRTLENTNRLLAYVDLSNLYTNERDCYRNIINNIIEPNINLFESIENDIEVIRAKELPPHNEYSRSIIKILNHFQGDLVIILDEIDALKSVNYSDNIFAQIRSNYFSRTNYPVLERLTYVLSGVIEPTELIKDKNKSPFNIGDKIYLDDFTYEEHNTFIEKSQLDISKGIADEIFSWTNGNPRLTFDLCAELENYILTIGEVDSEILKNIITKKYLTTYDIAPIDHIRELAKSNKDVRKAISNIHKKNTSEISDDIKGKLYLYGIINSKFNDETRIKNRIIELSLNDEWLKSIDKEREVSFVYALAKYTDKDYYGAIDIFNEVVLTSQNEKDVERSNYFLGICYLKTKKYENAIQYFSKDFKELIYRNDALAYLGVCQMGMGDAEGLNTLELAIKTESNTHAYHNALLNLAININDDEKALALFEKLYTSTLISDYSEKEELSRLTVLSLYYQADILEKDSKDEALKKLEIALKYSSLIDSLFLMYFKYYLEEEKDESIKARLVNGIVDNKFTFDNDESSPISFTEQHIYYYLDFVFNENDSLLFDKLLLYVKSSLLPDKTHYEIIYTVSTKSRFAKQQILTYLINNFNEIDDYSLIAAYRDLLLLNNKKESIYLDVFKKYLEIIIRVKTIIDIDIYIFAVCIKLYSDKKEINEGIYLCKILLEELEIGELEYESVIIYYWYSNLLFSKRDRDNAIKYADTALELIKESNGRKISMIDEAGLKSISEQLQQIKISSVITNPIYNNSKKYGRNDRVKVRYKDGVTKEDKYKKLEADILAERCIIVS